MAVVANLAEHRRLGDILQLLLSGELGCHEILEVEKQDRNHESCQQTNENYHGLVGSHWLALGISIINDFTLGSCSRQHQCILFSLLQQECVERVLDALLTIEGANFSLLSGHFFDFLFGNLAHLTCLLDLNLESIKRIVHTLANGLAHLVDLSVEFLECLVAFSRTLGELSSPGNKFIKCLDRTRCSHRVGLKGNVGIAIVRIVDKLIDEVNDAIFSLKLNDFALGLLLPANAGLGLDTHVGHVVGFLVFLNLGLTACEVFID